MNDFAFYTRQAALTHREAAYLCNVGTRAIRRWMNDSDDHLAPDDAVQLVRGFARGEIDPGWADWRTHGTDIQNWKPVKVDGRSGATVAIALREQFGPDALTRLAA